MNSKTAVRQLFALKKASKSLRLAAEWKKPWQSLISTILSARTRDDKTIEVSSILYKKYRSLPALANAPLKRIKSIISPVNYYKTKAKNIKNCAKILVSKHNGKIPKQFEKLIQLPGVGRKTANVFLAHQGKPSIGVDTHITQISRYLGWTSNSKPEKIEQDLQKLFPKNLWRSINYIVVRFGQSYRSKKQKHAILNKIK